MVSDAKLDSWIARNKNVLFTGAHGIGKTAIMQSAFERNKITWHYFSAPTMDPWVDFVGVPDKHEHEDGTTSLTLIKPRQFQDGSVHAIFFDEFNRASDKVKDAVMEVLQFKSINGTPIPGLRMVWAAINPADDEGTYNVEPLDVAIQDRFEIQVTLPNDPNRSWFIETYGERIGNRAVDWWHTLPENAQSHVSPRRLQYALEELLDGGDVDDVLHAEARPQTLKRKIERVKSTTSHTERWLSDPDNYIQEIATRDNHNIDAIAAFTELKDMAMDQAVGYIAQLPPEKLSTLATSPQTIGIMLRYVHNHPTSRKMVTALTKITTDPAMSHFRAQAHLQRLMSDEDFELAAPLSACATGETIADKPWTVLYEIVARRSREVELSYSDCATILTISTPEDSTKPSVFAELLTHYVETHYPNKLVTFVQLNPAAIAKSY